MFLQRFPRNVSVNLNLATTNIFHFFYHTKLQSEFQTNSKRRFTWQAGRYNKLEGTINKIRRLQSFLHNLPVTFIWDGHVFHPVVARWDPPKAILSSFQAGSRHRRDNVFNISFLLRDKKRPALIFFLNEATKTCHCLFNILPLRWLAWLI